MTIFQDNLSSRYDVKYLKVVDDKIKEIYQKADTEVIGLTGREFTTEEEISTDSGDFMFDKLAHYTMEAITEAFPELYDIHNWDDSVTDLCYEIASIVGISGYAHVKDIMNNASIAVQLVSENALGLRRWGV